MSRPYQLLLFALVTAIAFFLGRLSIDQDTATDQAASNSHSKLPGTSSSGRTSPGTGQQQKSDESRPTSSENAVTALRKALDSPTNIGRQRSFATALLSMRSEDGPAIHQLFLDGDAQGRYFYGEWTDFWTRWGEIDPLSALEYINSGALGEAQMSTSTSAVLPSVGHLGEDAARQFLGTIDLDEGGGNRAALDVLAGLAEVDLDAATRIALANSDAGFFRHAVDKITEAAVQSGGLENLTSWYEQLPTDSPMREAAMQSVFNRVSRAGIDAERNWIDQAKESPTPASAHIVGSHAGRSMEKDPQGTIDWIATLPATEANQQVLPVSIAHWAHYAPTAASTWMDANQDHPNYDTIAAHSAVQLSNNDYDAALKRAATVKDDKMRTKLIGELEKLHRGNPEAGELF